MSLELSPENRVYVKLNRFNHLKSPKICLSLTSKEEMKDIKINEFKPFNRNEDLMDCNSCQVLKRLVCIKDIAIDRLNADREDLKLKLTQINNKNIELNQKLKRLETEKQESIKSDAKTDDKSDYKRIKAKYRELEAINKHLRQHLNTLRIVFNELHSNSSESTSNEGTNITTNASNSSTTSAKTITKTEPKTDTKSTSTDININIEERTEESLRIDSTLGENSRVESLDETEVSKFEKWFNK